MVNLVDCLATNGLAILDVYKETDYCDIYVKVCYFKNGPMDVTNEFQNNVKD